MANLPDAPARAALPDGPLARTPPESFEAAMSELEQILQVMERGNVTLEESLAKYERGTFLIQYCRKVLTDAEQKVEVLTRGPDGSLKTEPLNPG